VQYIRTVEDNNILDGRGARFARFHIEPHPFIICSSSELILSAMVVHSFCNGSTSRDYEFLVQNTGWQDICSNSKTLLLTVPGRLIDAFTQLRA